MLKTWLKYWSLSSNLKGFFFTFLNRVLQRTYRLACLRSTTPEELYARKVIYSLSFTLIYFQFEEEHTFKIKNNYILTSRPFNIDWGWGVWWSSCPCTNLWTGQWLGLSEAVEEIPCLSSFNSWLLGGWYNENMPPVVIF